MRRPLQRTLSRGFTSQILVFLFSTHFLCLCDAFVSQKSFRQAGSRLGSCCQTGVFFTGKHDLLSSEHRSHHHSWGARQEPHSPLDLKRSPFQIHLNDDAKGRKKIQKISPLQSRISAGESPPATAEDETVEFADELMRSFGSYALSTIHARAIPDTRDGLKPVHRRILYAMQVGLQGLCTVFLLIFCSCLQGQDKCADGSGRLQSD